MAGVEGLRSRVQRIVVVALGEGHDEAGQEEEDADPGGFLADSRHRFYGPHGEEHPFLLKAGR